MKQKIVIAGGSGLIGSTLKEFLLKENFQVISIVRKGKQKENSIYWDDVDNISEAINGSFAVINLSGAPLIGKRWSEKYKKILLESRILTTRKLVGIINNSKNKPTVFINASAVGYYGTNTGDKPYVETSPPGTDFLAHLCEKWEDEARKAKIRTVIIRSAIVLAKEEGALPRIVLPYKFFLGGPIGSGDQPFAWIHIKDEIGIIHHSLINPVEGPINASAPEQVTSLKFSKALGSVLHRPSLINVPTIFLKVLYGEASSLLTKGVNVDSSKIRDLGYEFHYPRLETALKNIFT